MLISMGWGDLVDKDNKPVADVKNYQVWILKANGRRAGTEPLVTIKAGAVDAANKCCTGDRYMFGLATNSTAWTGKQRLAIAPVSKNGAVLPFVTVSGSITDNADGGQAVAIKGDFSFEASAADAAKMAADPQSKGAFGAAVADSLPGVKRSEVFVTEIWVDGVRAARRLDGRRLANAVIKVVFEIISSNTALTVKAGDIKPATLAANIKKQQAAIGNDIVVTKVPTVSAITVAVVGTPAATTGAASALFFPSMAAILAVGAQLLF